MDFLVLNKVFIAAEGLLAFGTAVELFCSVHGRVSNQVRRAAETLTRDIYGALCTCVNPSGVH